MGKTSSALSGPGCGSMTGVTVIQVNTHDSRGTPLPPLSRLTSPVRSKNLSPFPGVQSYRVVEPVLGREVFQCCGTSVTSDG